jgi:uncharacterized protein DUF2845
MRSLRLGGRSFLVSLTLVGSQAIGVPAHAEGGFRCGSRLVLNGETEDDVAGKCGDPDGVRTWTETRTESIWENGQRIDRSVPIEYMEWKYDFGRDRLQRYLTFVQGRLTAVRTGEYGRK